MGTSLQDTGEHRQFLSQCPTLSSDLGLNSLLSSKWLQLLPLFLIYMHQDKDCLYQEKSLKLQEEECLCPRKSLTWQWRQGTAQTRKPDQQSSVLVLWSQCEMSPVGSQG